MGDQLVFSTDKLCRISVVCDLQETMVVAVNVGQDDFNGMRLIYLSIYLFGTCIYLSTVLLLAMHTQTHTLVQLIIGPLLDFNQL